MITFKRLGKYGRLGNQMFQVASTIGIAEKNNQPWLFPVWDHPFRYFPAFDGLDLVKEKKIPWGYHDVKIGNESTSLHGYLQSEKYFKHCEDLIRELFVFSPTALSSVILNNPFISVHVRRGDYDGENHTLLGRDYYDKALALLPKLPVYVFSDDTNAARDVVPSADYVWKNSPAVDMRLMTHAKYHVIANSSFSWWGAWLAESEKVIAPAQWFGPKKIKWSTKDLIPEDWVIV